MTTSAAVIGANMAPAHANAWRQVGTIDLGTRQLTPSPTPVRRDRRALHGCRYTTNWRDIVDDPTIDIVSIVVANTARL